MDKTLLDDDEITDTGLVLNDEDSIIQDEKEIIFSDKNKTQNRKQDKQSQEFIPENAFKKDADISREEVKCENNLEYSNSSEQNSKVFSCIGNKGTESTKALFNENLSNETEQNKYIGGIAKETFETPDSDLFQKTNGLQLLNAHDTTHGCENLINNTIKENGGSNVINSKFDSLPKGHIKCNNEKNKERKDIEKRIIRECDEDTACGFEMFKPRWLQSFATARVFVILYSMMGILQSAYYTTLIGSLSTLEKRFAFKSKISGVIMSVDEITPVLLGMIIGYYATKVHRPRMISIGMLLSSGCCFVSCLPYFIYGPMRILGFNDINSNTGPTFCDSNIETESCDPDRPQNLFAVSLLIFGSFLKGFGNLVYYTVGLSYLDDNTSKKSTPIYLAIALALRLLGPLLGFLMSSGFLKYYENPLYDPGFGPDDPRWIGAWWIGFFLQGVLLVIFTIPIAFFPRRLPNQKKIEKNDVTAQEEGLKELFRGMVSALKRLGKNPVFIVLIIQTTMKIFGHFGHAIMLPKYMENQFRLSASEASLYSGAISIFCIIISTVLGGFLIWKFRPRIKVLLGGMIASETTLCIGYLILMIPRCQTSEMLHFGMNEEGLILNSACNLNCECSTSTFTPFCGPDGNTLYFSPCYAGCTEEVNITISKTRKMSKKFDNCSCVDEQLGSTITEGFCPDENCGSKVIAYLIVYFFLVTLSNIFTVAATMILLRSVQPSDKSLALGTFETFICLFGFIPFPVTYGALVDSACLVWEKSCGETGNCWFYDMEKYSYLLHGASSLFCFLCLCCLITLYFLSSRIRDLYNEEDEEEKKYVEIKLDTVSGSVTKL